VAGRAAHGHALHGGVTGHAAHGHAPHGRNAPSWAKGTVGGRSTDCCDKLDALKAECPTTAQETYHRLGKCSEEEAGPEEDAFFNSGGLCFNADNKFFCVGKHRSSQLWHRGRHPCCKVNFRSSLLRASFLNM
jgi:hypothetical protein